MRFLLRKSILIRELILLKKQINNNILMMMIMKKKKAMLSKNKISIGYSGKGWRLNEINRKPSDWGILKWNKSIGCMGDFEILSQVNSRSNRLLQWEWQSVLTWNQKTTQSILKNYFKIIIFRFLKITKKCFVKTWICF